MINKLYIGNSTFWSELWSTYLYAPSIALCRVPELEYASQLELRGRVLDHCCGDGFFAALSWPTQNITAGCDINRASIRAAEQHGRYRRLDVCDAAAGLPYRDRSFSLVFDNSSLEHIPDLQATLKEIARVTRVGGIFAFNILNHRFFDWWPLSHKSREEYKSWQPVHHILKLDQWQSRLAEAGLDIVSVEGYFDRAAARDLAFLDYLFSGYYIMQRRSVFVELFLRSKAMRYFWYQRLSSRIWKTAPDQGAGYFIRAVRSIS